MADDGQPTRPEAGSVQHVHGQPPSSAASQRQDILEEILREMREREQRGADSFTALTMQASTDSIELLTSLQEASIRLTYPEDWVQFATRDGAKVCFLQDAGCERIRSLWQIDFASVDLRRDVEGRLLEDESYVAEAIVRGVSRLTRETVEEMGFRSSKGFFEKDWDKARQEESAVELERIKSNIRKAAIANAKGRCIRTISGTSQVPQARIQQLLGEKAASRVRGVKFETGTKGGSGDFATAPQLKKLAIDALKRVSGLNKLFNMNDLYPKLENAQLTKGKASGVIERLVAAEPGKMTVEQFQQLVGVTLYEEGANEE